jgi:hypothetical protein
MIYTNIIGVPVLVISGSLLMIVTARKEYTNKLLRLIAIPLGVSALIVLYAFSTDFFWWQSKDTDKVDLGENNISFPVGYSAYTNGSGFFWIGEGDCKSMSLFRIDSNLARAEAHNPYCVEGLSNGRTEVYLDKSTLSVASKEEIISDLKALLPVAEYSIEEFKRKWKH